MKDTFPDNPADARELNRGRDVSKLDTHRHLLFIDLVDSKGRKTHLSAYGRRDDGFLAVSGNLEHGAKLKPATPADGVALIVWIQEQFGMADPAATIAALRASDAAQLSATVKMQAERDAALDAAEHNAGLYETANGTIAALRGALEGFVSLCPSAEGLGGHAPIGAFTIAASHARAALAMCARDGKGGAK